MTNTATLTAARVAQIHAAAAPSRLLNQLSLATARPNTRRRLVIDDDGGRLYGPSLPAAGLPISDVDLAVALDKWVDDVLLGQPQESR